MSQLDDLLARARDPGNITERRRFTLSRDKAIEKQREFALRDPLWYVLEIIQGAIFGGATYMAVDARKNEVFIAWVGGEVLEREHLDNLFDYLFASRTERSIQHLVQLAVGVNALLQCGPQSIRIQSGRGGRGNHVEIMPDGSWETGVTEDPLDGTFLVADFVGSGALSRFRAMLPNGRSRFTNVTSLIEERCLYTPVPILLNGNAPFGYRASRNIEIFGAAAQQQFDQGQRRGVVAIHTATRAPTGFRIVVGGIWITKLELDELADVPLVGVICDDGLRKTADHSDIVQDGRYVSMLHAIQPHATELLVRTGSKNYAPPRLPPIPDDVPTRTGSPGVELEFDPLPDQLPMLGARGTTTVADLQDTDDEPLFWCTPELASDLLVPADPVRFPFRILVLTPGQMNTLASEAPDAQINRLNAPTDVDFVLRVYERGVETRTLTVEVPQGQITVRLHLAGRMPSWSAGRPGIPVAVQVDGRTHSTGVVTDTAVALVGVPPYELSVPLELPRISLIVHTSDTGRWLDDEVARTLLAHAHELAAPTDGPHDRQLLAALLGTEVIPRFVPDPPPSSGQPHPDSVVRLRGDLPPSWPLALTALPLADSHLGPLSMDRFLACIEAGEVAWVRDTETLEQLAALETRFGFGHLAVHGTEVRPLFAVARRGGRWMRVDPSSPVLDFDATHLAYVAHHFAPATHDDRWALAGQPFPELVALRRVDSPDVDLEDGWAALYELLYGTLIEHADAIGSRTSERARAMGRIALLHLARHVSGSEDDAVLLPTDGGARQSIQGLEKARFSAVNGVSVAEPHTFAVTFDELGALFPDGGARLRYDDDPGVWQSLARTPAEGWLTRHEIQETRLRGWLGLRKPYDPTAGILLRSTGRLIGLPDLDERVPCHGLLWPLTGHHLLTQGEIQLLRLAGLRMYDELGRILTSAGHPDDLAAARLYAWGFCLRAHARGRLSGTANQLARLVEVIDTSGGTWGTLDRWLVTPDAHRPPAPSQLPEISVPELPSHSAEPSELGASLQARLEAALPPRLHCTVTLRELKRQDPVRRIGSNNPLNIGLQLNTAHSVVDAAARGSVPARELLLVECARQCALWGRGRREAPSMTAMLAVLLSQRLED